jgi:hypothetical protein
MASAKEDFGQLVGSVPGEVSYPPSEPKEDYTLKDYALFPADLTVGSAANFLTALFGNLKGLATGISSENYGTQEGVKEAEEAAAYVMQEYGIEPTSRITGDLLNKVDQFLVDNKLNAMQPLLNLLPSFAPGSATYVAGKGADAAKRTAKSTTEGVGGLIEESYRKRSDPTESAGMLQNLVLPPRLEIFQGSKSKTFDPKSAEIFEKAEQKAITENPDISRYDLNIKSWQETVNAVERGEAQFPTFRGLDNQIRQEVPDTGFTFKLPFTDYQKPKGIKRFYDEEVRLPEGMEDPYKIKNLDKLIDFPELFKAYSSMQKDKVKFVDKSTFDPYNPFAERGSRDYRTRDAGERSFDTGEIGITPIREDSVDLYPIAPFEKKPSPETAYKSILLHEIQHAIQQAEGFAGGTSGASIKRDLLSLSNALKEKKQKILKDIEEKNKGVLVAGGSKEKIREEQKVKNEQRLKQVDVINDLIKQTEVQRKRVLKEGDSSKTVYDLNLGEIESRIVEERQNLSMSERLKKFPLKRFFDKKGSSFVFDDKTTRFIFDKKPAYGLSLFKKNFPVLSNISRRDLEGDELFTSLEEKKRRDKNLTNYIIQQLGPKQAKDLGFDKD